MSVPPFLDPWFNWLRRAAIRKVRNERDVDYLVEHALKLVVSGERQAEGDEVLVAGNRSLSAVLSEAMDTVYREDFCDLQTFVEESVNDAHTAMTGYEWAALRARREMAGEYRTTRRLSYEDLTNEALRRVATALKGQYRPRPVWHSYIRTTIRNIKLNQRRGIKYETDLASDDLLRAVDDKAPDQEDERRNREFMQFVTLFSNRVWEIIPELGREDAFLLESYLRDGAINRGTKTRYSKLFGRTPEAARGRWDRLKNKLVKKFRAEAGEPDLDFYWSADQPENGRKKNMKNEQPGQMFERLVKRLRAIIPELDEGEVYLIKACLRDRAMTRETLVRYACRFNSTPEEAQERWSQLKERIRRLK